MQRRILAAFLSLISVAVVSILVINTWSMRRAIRTYNSTHAAVHSELLPSFVVLYYDNNQSWEGIEYELIRLSILAGTEVTIVDLDNLVIASTEIPDIGAPYDIPPQLNQEFEVLDASGDPVGRVFVRSTDSTLPVDDALSANLTNSLLVTLLLVGLASLFMAIQLSRSISRPLNRIGSAARRLAQGDYSTRIEVPGTRDEVAALAQTFNQMASGLENVEQVRRKVVADVSHDFRTPLTVLRGYLDGLIHGHIIDRPTAMRAFEAMNTEIEYLSGLVDTMKEAAELDAGQVRLNQERFEIRPLIDDVLVRLRPILEENRTIIALDGVDSMRLTADRRLIGQLLYNLIHNSIQHNDRPVTIRVQTHVDLNQGDACLSVSDDGIGIPEEEHQRVFDRFHRLDPARGRQTGGTGMGLSIVQSIAKAHDGRVDLKSNRPQPGVTFYLYLPIL